MASTVEILSRVATRPTWAEVSLTALQQNFRTVAKHAGANVTVCAVVKADAYGHGAVECSRALQEQGLRIVMLTTSDENEDIDTAYLLGANSYVVKPMNFEQYADIMGAAVR